MNYYYKKTEIKNQTNLAEKINLNSLIMKECYNIQELVENLNKTLKDSLKKNDIDCL